MAWAATGTSDGGRRIDEGRTMLRTKAFGLVAGLAAGLGLLLAIGPVGAQQDPPGNNATVKVDGVDFDSHQNNEPHVGCSFQIDFYGYDQGNLTATVSFTGVPPTGGGLLASDNVFIGQDAAGGGGDLDASRTYDLSAALAGIAPQPNQGHHVHLAVEAPGPGGSKQKTFWVEGCGGTTTTTTPPTTTPPTTTSSTTVPPTTVPPITEPPTTEPPTTAPPTTEATTTAPPTTEATTTSSSTTTSEAPPTSAGPTTTIEPAAPAPRPPSTPKPPEPTPEAARSGSLARTGSDILPVVGVGLGLLALGVVLALLARRHRLHQG